MIISEKMARTAWDTLCAACADPEHAGVELEAVTEGLVNAAYRVAARKTHPDAGGTAEAFAQVDRAKHIVLRWLVRRPTPAEVPHGGVEECPRCGGSGFVMRRHGFREMRAQCPSCRGSGEVPERDDSGDRLS